MEDFNAKVERQKSITMYRTVWILGEKTRADGQMDFVVLQRLYIANAFFKEKENIKWDRKA